MAKYDIGKLLISILEYKVKDVIGDDAIAVIRAPVTEAELQRQLNAAAQRTEERWLATYADRDARDAVQGMPLADLSAVQSAIRGMYDSPITPVAAQTLREQLTNVLPKGFEAGRVEDAVADYLETLRQELVTVDGLREKLIALAELETARRTTQTAQNTGQATEELRRLNDQVAQLMEYFLGQPRDATLQADTQRADQLNQLEAEYRQWLIDTFKNLDFKGLTNSVRPMLLPLEQVYVQLRAVAEVPEAADEFTPEERRILRHLEEQEREGRAKKEPEAEERELYLRLDAARRARWSRERLERFSIADSLKNSERRGLVILGDPGSGKSTLLHFAGLLFARGPEAVTKQLGIQGDEADRLPILAPLAFYDDMLTRVDADLTIAEFLGLYYEKRRELPGLAPVFGRAIEAGRALVLLDGLDEVIEEDRRKFVAEQASAFIRRVIARGNRVLLTSRIYGYRAAPLSVDLPHVTVLDFRQEEIELFARQWNAAIADWEYSDRPAEQRQKLALENERNLLEEIRSNPGVERLAANPLLLSMLALLRPQVGSLPQQRIRLYASYMTALIDVWEITRTPGGRASAPSRPDVTKAELVLIPLALWMQQYRGSGTATRADIVAQISQEFLRQDGFEPAKRKRAIPADKQREATTRAGKFLDDMRQFSGLLVDRGQNAFGFRHLTFQEYFAGRGLARMKATPRWNLIQPNLHSNLWREPILLAAAQLGAMQTDEQAATLLARKILGAKSMQEKTLHRDLLLAADCAVDDINVELPLLRQLVRELSQMARSRIPAQAAEAVERLVGLAKLSNGDRLRLPEAVANLSIIVQQVSSSGIRFNTFVNLTGSLYSEHSALRHIVTAKVDDADDSVRAAAIRALAGQLAGDEALRRVVTAKLEDANGFVRAAAISALAGVLRYVSAIGSLASHVDWRTRLEVVSALTGSRATLTDFRFLFDDLRCIEASSACTAAIGALAGQLARDETLRRAVTAKVDDADDSVRAAAIRALAGQLAGDETLRRAVVAKLEDANDEHGFVRAAAIEALAGQLAGDEALRRVVTAKLEDANGFVRAEAIRALAGQLVGDEALQRAVTAKLEDTNESVRTAAIGALAGQLAEDDTLRRAVTAKLEDTNESVRAAAISALAGQLAGDEALRRAVTAKLEDASGPVRGAAIETLAGQLAEDEALRRAVTAKLADASNSVRTAAIRALAPLVGLDAIVRGCLTPALRLDDDAMLQSLRSVVEYEKLQPRPAVVQGFAQWLTADPAAWAEVITMITAEDWRLRLSGIEIVVAAGETALLQMTPRLLAAIDDHRGLDSWPARLAAAELYLNDWHFSQAAIDIILRALEYGAHPLAIVPNASDIRRQAALALGKLKAEFRRPDISEKLEALLTTEQDPRVLDGLLSALQSLAAAPE